MSAFRRRHCLIKVSVLNPVSLSVTSIAKLAQYSTNGFIVRINELKMSVKTSHQTAVRDEAVCTLQLGEECPPLPPSPPLLWVCCFTKGKSALVKGQLSHYKFSQAEHKHQIFSSVYSVCIACVSPYPRSIDCVQLASIYGVLWENLPIRRCGFVESCVVSYSGAR